MPSPNEIDQLKSYLEDLIPEGTLEAAADDSEAPMRMRSTGRRVRKTEAERAQAALQKLASGREIDDREAFLMEAIIIPDKRPAIDILDGDYEVAHPDWQHFNDGDARDRIIRAIPSVGRVELPDNDAVPYGGTGFAVAENLLMTNRHVAEIFASGLGQRNLAFLAGQSAALDFRQENGSDASQVVQVERVRMIHPYWDMALLEVKELPEGVRPLCLSQRDPDALRDADVAVLGYPGFDPRNNTDVQHRVFGGTYYVKRLQPGLLRKRAIKLSFGNRVSAVTHDASTLGGNSGSCVIDIATGEVVALHFAGRYKKANYAVPASELALDPHVIAAGVRFAGPAPEAGADSAWAEQWEAADRDAEAPAETDSVTGGQSVTASPGALSFTIPLHVTISLGEPQHAAAQALAAPAVQSAPVASAQEKLVRPTHDPDYSTRRGYDPMFLGAEVPMPQPRDDAELSVLDDGSHVLHYHHFSLIMNRRRRLAMLTAANVDARPGRKEPEAGRDYSRAGLNGFTSDNDKERWFRDPRIPATHQLSRKFFDRDRKAFDKGHVVRREAVAWGDSYREVQLANGDSFHATNCSPQVAGFNRSNLRGEWGQLENHVLGEAQAERLCVFAGPVLRDDDPIFSGVDDDGTISVRIPRAYWKVIVAIKDGKLECFPFSLEHDLSQVDFEFQVGGDWAGRLVSLKSIEEAGAGLRFDASLHAADRSGGTGSVTPRDARIIGDGPI